MFNLTFTHLWMNQGKLGVQYFAQGYELGNETQSGGPAVPSDPRTPMLLISNPTQKTKALLKVTPSCVGRKTNKQTKKQLMREGVITISVSEEKVLRRSLI